MVALGGALALELATHAFIANTLGGNTHQPFDLLTFQYNLGQLVTFQAAPAVLALMAVIAKATFDAICWR